MVSKFFRKNRNEDDSRNQKESHLKNLIVLTLADGHIAEIENHLLIAIAHRLGFNEKDIDRIKNDMDNIEFTLPSDYDDKIEQFQDLLTLMSVDGHIDPEEEEYCIEMAKRYELTHNVVEDLLNKFR